MTTPFGFNEFDNTIAFQPELDGGDGTGTPSGETVNIPVTQGCTGPGDCPVGETCSPDGICVPIDTTPVTTPSPSGLCDGPNFGNCPDGQQCVQNGEGVTRDNRGNILNRFPIFQCEPVVVAPPFPEPVCPGNGTVCGPVEQLNATTRSALCCLPSQVCCTDPNGNYFCADGVQCPPPPRECPPDGTFAQCVDRVGTATVYTGRRDDLGDCAVRLSFSSDCVDCPKANAFLRCSGTTGIYSTGKFVKNNLFSSTGECGTYTKENDPVCAPTCTPSRVETCNSSGNIVITITEADCSVLESVALCENGCTQISPTRATCNQQICDPRGTFIQCIDVFTAQYADGICGSYTDTAPSDGRCGSCPERGQLVQCIDTLTAIYTDGNCGTFTGNANGLCGVAPSPTPSRTPRPSDIPQVSPTPTPSRTPQPTPTPSPLVWRSCVDGNTKLGTPPTDYVQVPFAKGGTCWEPVYEVGFVPDLNKVLRYNWRRNALVYPESKTFEVQNPSFARNFEVTLKTNPDILITPEGASKGNSTVTFLMSPRSNKKVTVTVPVTLLNKLADGVSNLEMTVEIREV